MKPSKYFGTSEGLVELRPSPLRWPRIKLEDTQRLGNTTTRIGVIHPSATPSIPTANLAVSRVKCIWETDKEK